MPKTIPDPELRRVVEVVTALAENANVDAISKAMGQTLHLRTLQRRLALLCQQGWLESVGEARATRYRARSLEGLDQPRLSSPTPGFASAAMAQEGAQKRAQGLDQEAQHLLAMLALYPLGCKLDQIMELIHEPISRRTLQRRLANLSESGLVRTVGEARATRYLASAAVAELNGMAATAFRPLPPPVVERAASSFSSEAGRWSVPGPHSGLQPELRDEPWSELQPEPLVGLRDLAGLALPPEVAMKPNPPSGPLPEPELPPEVVLEAKFPSGVLPKPELDIHATEQRMAGGAAATGVSATGVPQDGLSRRARMGKWWRQRYRTLGEAYAAFSGVRWLRRLSGLRGRRPGLQRERSDAEATPGRAYRPGLGGWNFYFLAKLLMYWKGFIGFHPLENLAFAAVLLLPVRTPATWRIRLALSIPMGAGLLYHDSWLPPVNRIFAQAGAMAKFDLAYLVELIGRFINPHLVALLVLLWAAYWLLSHWLRIGLAVLTTLTVLSMLPGPAQQGEGGNALAQSAAAGGGGGGDEGGVGGAGGVVVRGPTALLKAFYARELARRATWGAPSATASPFDIIFIHICSLAWDDLKAVGQDSHPLWKKLDVTFTQFNSAASYSGPAAIRVLRAPCGQPQAAALYDPASPECYLMGDLKRFGFEAALAMNHDGHFEDFLKSVQQQELNLRPLSLDGIAVAQHAFDDSPIFDDGSVLKRWWETRLKNPAPRVALYYNTISLHDGNKLVGASLGEDSIKTYKFRVGRLLDQINDFMTLIEQSKRNAIVVVIPEHGAAYRGDKMQIAGLREIPSPTITMVPVGLRVIGAQDKRSGNALSVNEPSSYLALTQLLGKLMQNSPFDASSYVPSDYADGLPTTPFVAESNETIVLRMPQGGYMLRQDANSAWVPYDPG